MPNRWPISSGNWSNAAIWSGSLIPTASDDVFTNTFTINMDTSINIRSLNNTATTGVTAGGTYNFNSGSISASISSATSSLTANNSITVTATTGTVTISAPNVSFTGAGTQLINYTGSCDLIITASSFLGGGFQNGVLTKTSTGNLFVLGSLSSTNSVTQVMFNITSPGSVEINGNITGQFNGVITNSTAYSVQQSAGTLRVIGNILGGRNTSVSNGNSAIAISGTVTAVITGSLTGGEGAGAAIITLSGTPTINISGSVIGGAGSNALAIGTNSIINVNGNMTATTTAALSTSNAIVLTHSGSATASTTSPAVVSTSATARNIFSGPFVNTTDTMAVQCVNMLLTQDASTSWNFGNITLFSPDRLAFYPSASDIRQGVTYADGTVSGSLAMPPPTAVIAGTPTDNTTGSAVLTPEQLQDAFWGAPLSQMTNTGSIGARLAKSATLDSTGNQIASYLI